jgi:hypothetical protein
MPYLQEFGLMLNNDPLDLIEFASSEAIIGGQNNRIEPKFGLIGSSFDMDMRRFLPFITEEIEAEPTDA